MTYTDGTGTELPWRAVLTDYGWYVTGPEDHHVIAMGSGVSSEADTKFAVRCVNNHQPILDVIDNAVEFLTAIFDGEFGNDDKKFGEAAVELCLELEVAAQNARGQTS